MSNQKILVKIGEEQYEYPSGITVEAIAAEHQKNDAPLIVAAKVNNKLMEMFNELDEDCSLSFVDLKSLDGMKIYQRSLSFIMIRAAMEVFKGIHVKISHSLSKGLYCEFEYDRQLEKDDFEAIKARMREIVNSEEAITKEMVKRERAIEIFDEFGFSAKSDLMKYREYDSVNIYSCGWLKDYFYGYMVNNTKYIQVFDLMQYDNGAILRHPTRFSPFDLPKFEEHKKLAKVFMESEKWGEILGISYVANLNKCVEEGCHEELMRVQEALHEKKIANIADMITEQKRRLILIAGPSSSGKTSFANRLKIQLKVNGLNPITMSTDDYFVNRDKTPVDENGEYDFESINAVNTDLFNRDLTAILAGEEVELPTFNFQTGEREYHGHKLQVDISQPIIIEGIHGLNEKLTASIDKNEKFKIYISALTQLNIDDHNRIPTTDTRLIRRIARDSKFRGHSALKTLQMWQSVRRGEERNIFPYQEEADVMFNSAIVHELAVLKNHVKDLLEAIEPTVKEYSEARRLLKFLSYFIAIDADELVPKTSILKEFIGGSSFTG